MHSNRWPVLPCCTLVAAFVAIAVPAAADARLTAFVRDGVLRVSNPEDRSYGVRANAGKRSVTIDALGRPARAGLGCRRTSATRLRCAARGVRRVEIVGSRRGDRLYYSGSIPVRIRARGGPDTLIGGNGLDTLDGGPGRDRIFAKDGSRDTVICGAGPDGTVEVDTLDRRSRCGKVDRELVGARTDRQVSIDRRGARVELYCSDHRRSCAGSVTVRLAGRREPLARRRYRGIRGGTTRLVVLPLSHSARRAVASRAPFADGSVVVTTGSGRGFTSVQTLKVRLAVVT